MRLLALLFILSPLISLAQTYRVGPGDLLKITVLEMEELNKEYRVDNLGHINLPYLGSLDVKENTATDLQEVISNKLQKEYMNDPQVFVDIMEFNFRPISVIGAVMEPGKLKQDPQNLDLLDAITQSGGVKENHSDRIFVIRKTPIGLNETLEISYRGLMIEGLSYLNIPLYPGDTVNIPVERPLVVSVIGEINKPGELKFSRESKVTILQVIAKAGGFTDYAKRHKVKIKREVNGEQVQIPINVKNIERNKEPNFVMQHNDVVIVP